MRIATAPLLTAIHGNLCSLADSIGISIPRNTSTGGKKCCGISMGMHRCRYAVHNNVWFPCISIATFSSQQNFHSKFFLPTTMPQQNNNPTDVLWGTKTPVDFWQGTVVPRDNCFHRNKKILWMCCGELKSLWIYSRGP